MSYKPSHHDKSLDHIAAVVQTADHLEQLHSAPHVDRAAVAKGYDAIRQGLKLAEVHALLAVAEAIEKSNNRAGVTM